MYNVFVFGTLKAGFPNFAINQGHRQGGHFITAHAYPLYLVGERYSPWLILAAGEGLPVRGQLFQVDAAGLAAMDTLERISEPDGYQRVEIAVVCEVTGHMQRAFVYGKSIAQCAEADIRSELLAEYTLHHATLYRSRYTSV